jgi:hypothetical protein
MQVRWARWRRAGLMMGLAAAPAVMAGAQNARPAVDPDAMAALERMGAFLRAQQQFHAMGETSTDEVLPNDQKVQHDGVVDLKVRRPNRLMASIDSDQKTERIFYDGKTLTIFQPKIGYYAQAPAPATLHETVDQAEEHYGIDFPMADLFAWGTARARPKDILSATNVGVSSVKGTPCDHYAFHQADVDWELWVERGARPLPRKEVITTITERARPQHVAVVSWDLSPRLDEAMFQFKAPAGAHPIGFEPTPGGGGAGQDGTPVEPGNAPAQPRNQGAGGTP